MAEMRSPNAISDNGLSGSDTLRKPPSNPTEALLDHIVVLLPHHDLLHLPTWITANFKVTSGGLHADGKTENNLILFRDGSYIELIAFVDDNPKNREEHRWGNCKPGIIDYALTTKNDPECHWEALQTRLSKLDKSVTSKYDYSPPIAGGRRQRDGTEVKWEVTPPRGVNPGVLPFFCHDVTPRNHRVPLSEEACTHPCGAYGLYSMTAGVSDVVGLKQVYSAVLGNPPGCPPAFEEGASFAFGTVNTTEGPGDPRIHLHPGRDDEQHLAIGKDGVVFDNMTLGAISKEKSGAHVIRLGAGAYSHIVLRVLDPH